MPYIKKKRQVLNLPPNVPYDLPFVGHMPYMTIMPNKFVDWCNKTYEEASTINILGKSITLVSGELAQEALQVDYLDLSVREGTVKGKASLLNLNTGCTRSKKYR
jgi:hypothetical protein